MVSRSTRMWRLRLLGCFLAAGISFSTARAGQDAQSQPAAVSSSPASATTVPPSAASAVAPSAQDAEYAPAAPKTPTKNIFHVKYISESAIYLDAGRNEGLDEGMMLHIVHEDPGGGATDAVRFRGQEPIADVRIFSVADTSAAAAIVKSREDMVKGDVAYLDIDSSHLRENMVNAAEVRKLSGGRDVFLRRPAG